MDADLTAVVGNTVSGIQAWTSGVDTDSIGSIDLLFSNGSRVELYCLQDPAKTCGCDACFGWVFVAAEEAAELDRTVQEKREMSYV